jgi:enoyl-CoA hydratase
MAMPETNIGLFPDVGGGYFLSRCPGHMGEYLALTGHAIGGADAIYAGLADAIVPSSGLASLWDSISGHGGIATDQRLDMGESMLARHEDPIERFFSLPSVAQITAALEGDGSDFARETAAALRERSPLMLHVTLEQVRRARAMTLADVLRMERGIMRHCFQLRPGVGSETVEGIRALVIDKDRQPRWKPSRIEEVTAEMVQAFFEPPWPPHAHPLRDLR